MIVVDTNVISEMMRSEPNPKVLAWIAAQPRAQLYSTHSTRPTGAALGGIGAHADDVVHMKRTADRLFGDNYRWSVLGAGRNQMTVAAIAAAMGGNVRVGLEDRLWVGAGQFAPSNASQVTQVRKIIEGLGLEVATPDEAREILALKGGDRVAF